MRFRNHSVLPLFALVCSLLLTACAGGEGGETDGSPPPESVDFAIEAATPKEAGPLPTDTIDALPLPTDTLYDTTLDQSDSCQPACDDSLACTDDLCVGAACSHPVKAGYCLIDGQCVADGATSATGCGRCNASNSPSTWTDDDSLCDQDAFSCTETTCKLAQCDTAIKLGFCFSGGECLAEGEASADNGCQICSTSTSTTALQALADASPCPDDGASCTEDRCEAGSCIHPVKANSCLVGGVCYANTEVNPSDDCQYCDASAASDAWATRPTGSACAGDGIDCTADVCSAGTCTHDVMPDRCLISGQCFQTGDLNPVSECQACQPSLATDNWRDANNGTPCTQDALSCTDNACFAGQCAVFVKAGSCMIAGACFSDGEANPTQPCQTCDTVTMATSWTPTADGAACADDGLSCTNDICTSGTCDHPVLADNCLIAGSCYNANATVSTADCTVCAPDVSSTLATNADGLSCSDGNSLTKLDFCLAGTCRGYSGTNWSWLSSDTATAANTVTHIDGDGFWVAGTLTNSGGTISGFLGKPDGTNGLTTLEYALDKPYLDISHRMAVGEEGLASYHNGTTWIDATDVSTVFGTDNLSAVWGTQLASTADVFFIGSLSGAIANCRPTSGGASFSCVSPSGISTAADIGSVAGTVTDIGEQDRVWAFRTNSFEDIYSYDPVALTFSSAAPQGCFDGTSTPCGNTSGRFLGSWARNASDVWAVGEAGLVMHYDGQAWEKVDVTSITATQTDYVFRSVTGLGDLVVLVGERAYNGTYHDLVLVKFNRLLNRWYSPQILLYTTLGNTHVNSYRLNDIAAAANGNEVCLVGSTWDTSADEEQAFYYYLP